MGYLTSSARKPQGYFELSRTLTYSVVAVAPLLLLYEMGVLFLNHGSPVGLRNAADAAFKEPFLLLGPYAHALLAAVLLFGVVAVYRFETAPRRIRMVPPYLGFMLLESALYAAAFGTVINVILRSIRSLMPLAPGMADMDLPTRFVLSLGAGLYEELVFRVILVAALFFLVRRVTGCRAVSAYVGAALLGAFLFSAYHYVGPFGDTFSIHSFLFRFLAGLILNILYLVRGFGITVYTHALYDLLVTILLA